MVRAEPADNRTCANGANWNCSLESEFQEATAVSSTSPNLTGAHPQIRRQGCRRGRLRQFGVNPLAATKERAATPRKSMA